ncbi:NRDE family protein [Pelagibacterales bacterium]|nr:NRDE family protein [Pelagibacterales bacterium]
MCSIVILRQSDSEWPIIIGANRDEMIERQSLPPGRHWEQQKHIMAGKDIEAGGTWLGVNDYGLVAAVLNRMDTLGPLENKRSRGELVLDALDHADASEALNAIVDIEKNSYRGFNMLIADNTNAYWLKSVEGSPIIEYFDIPEGLSMITAYDRNDMSSERIKTYLDQFSMASIPDPTNNDWIDWELLLGSSYSKSNNPLSAMCVKTDMGFQTVSSSLIALPNFEPKLPLKKPIFRFCPSAPDITPFQDVDL